MPERDENEEWRRLHNEGFHSMCHSLNIVKVIKSTRLSWRGYIARIEVDKLSKLAGKYGMRPLGRPKRRWENNIRIDLK